MTTSPTTHLGRIATILAALAALALIIAAATGLTTAAHAAVSRPHATRLHARTPSGETRPQLTLAMSDEQVNAYWNTYDECLVSHGVPTYPGRGLSPVQTAESPQAEAACRSVMPRMPIALNPSINPHFARDFHAELACLNADDVPVIATDDQGSYTYGTATNARQAWLFSLAGEPTRLQIEHSCELQAFQADDHPWTQNHS